MGECEDDDLKNAAVKVCNVDHAAARLITSHLRLQLPKRILIKTPFSKLKPFKMGLYVISASLGSFPDPHPSLSVFAFVVGGSDRSSLRHGAHTSVFRKAFFLQI